MRAAQSAVKIRKLSVWFATSFVVVPMASAQPALTLPSGSAQGAVTLEVEASQDRFGDIVSIAPDLSVGVTPDLTLSVLHSTFARTGFRGAAGGGLCATDPCANVYDAIGVEALYSLVRGSPALAANLGVYATSFDRDHYSLKVGAKARHKVGRVTFVTLPSVTVAVSERDAMVPNRDRLWLPVSGMVTLGHGISAGAGTGLKAPLDGTFDDSYEIAAGLLAGYAATANLSLGASWVHGKLIAGDAALPGGTDGFDSRALHVWATATY